MPDGSFPPDAFPAPGARSAVAKEKDAARRAQPAGAAAVGRLSDLAPLEAAAALYFRLWRAGEGGRARASADFIALLGTGHGAAALTALDRLSALLDAHGRRPLCAHSPACPCLGGDEACFARFLAAAATGEREDSMLIATLMIRADMAPLAVAMAEELAVALRRMALRVSPAAGPRAPARDRLN